MSEFSDPLISQTPQPSPEQRGTELDFTRTARSLMALSATLEADQLEIANQNLQALFGITTTDLAEFARRGMDYRRDRRDLREKNDSLTEQLGRDTVTGALSERGLPHAIFETAIRSVLNNEPMYVLYMDLNKFKVINDSYGHDVGDLWLGAHYDALRHFFSKDSKIARIHGDEFVVADTIQHHHRADDELDSNSLNKELTEIMGALDTFVPGELARNPNLRGKVDFTQLNQLDASQRPGTISTGGVFALPADVLEITKDITNDRFALPELVGRIKRLADQSMYQDKQRHHDGSLHRQSQNMQVTYQQICGNL